jgi:hypothetical protein
MRKQCKRKVWSTAINPIQHAIEGAAITSDALLNQLRARELAAIEAFRTGAATIQEWSDITGLLNVCETMAKGGIGPEALEACKTAEQELISAGKRFESTRRMATSGLGLQSFRDLYQYHDLQRQSVSRAEYDRWIRKATLRVKSKAPDVRDMADV